MYGTGTKKMLNLMILKILEKYSDADHCLTQQRIIELLDLEYGMNCDRKSVATNINSLRELGYDIVKDRHGVYLIRDFEDWELRVLIDSVLFSKTISRSKAKQLIEKLKTLGNKYFSAKVKHIVNLPELHRSDNTSVAVTLDALNDAISSGKKISFTYNSYGEDLKLHPRRVEPYIVSPYQMVATNGRYYLIANGDKYDDFAHYRVDKMTDVKILREPARPIREFAPNGLNLPRHMAEHIYMFSGSSVRVKFWIHKAQFDAVLDWFGKDFDILQRDDDRFLISVRVNLQAMKYWAMQFGEYVEVVEPQSLREKICSTAENIRLAHTSSSDTRTEPTLIEIPPWIGGDNFEELKPKFIVAGAGTFGAGIVDELRARSSDELEFIDEVEFISLSDEDLQRTSSEPIFVGGFKFTAWSFDPAIQKRLDEVDLILIVVDEKTLSGAVAFTAGSNKPKIFVQPDASHKSSGGNIFVQFDAANFADSVYSAIRGLNDLLYGDRQIIGLDFDEFEENILRSDAEDFVISFGESLDAAVNALDADFRQTAAHCLYVVTAARPANFASAVEKLQAYFPSAIIYFSVNVDIAMAEDTATFMIIAAR